MKKKKNVSLKILLKVKNLNTYIFLEFYKILAKDIRLYRWLLIKFENRLRALEKDITVSKVRIKLYKRLNKYLDMNKQIFLNYSEVHKKLKIQDLNNLPDFYLEDLRSKIYYCWRTVRFFNTNDHPYSIFLRGVKKVNVFDKDLATILEILLLGFDLNKLKFKIKKIMDKLCIKISNYLRDQFK